MPEGSVFNGRQDVLSLDYFKTLKVGDVLNNNEVHPLLWSKNAKSAKVEREAVAV
jgi:hypothetical protein